MIRCIYLSKWIVDTIDQSKSLHDFENDFMLACHKILNHTFKNQYLSTSLTKYVKLTLSYYAKSWTELYFDMPGKDP